MSIYIRLENITTNESKSMGPFEAVLPGTHLHVDQGNGWEDDWLVKALGPGVDVYDDEGEPYSWVEGVGPLKYWHNCYIVEGETVFDNADPYTNEPTMLRISREHDGDWTLDGINEKGQYSRGPWSYGDLDELLIHIPEFIEQEAKALKDPAPKTTYQVSVMWEVEATDPDEACEQILDNLEEAGVAVYSLSVEEADDEGGEAQ